MSKFDESIKSMSAIVNDLKDKQDGFLTARQVTNMQNVRAALAQALGEIGDA